MRASHTFTESSLLPVAILRPLGPKATEMISLVCPVGVLRSRPVRTSWIRALLSEPPVTILRPWGPKATLLEVKGRI